MSGNYDKQVELYNQLIASMDGVERKGKTMPYTSVNGHMFSFLSPAGTLGLRLSASDREQLMTEYGFKPMVQHGATMKEYLEIPLEIMENEIIPGLLKKSYNYVSALKPKPTK